MSGWDWLVLAATLGFIVGYGTWKTRRQRSLESYFRGDSSQKWWTIGISVMATQASAITFISTPGQAYESGLGFIQFYFGLPLAMIFVSVFFIPLYYKYKVYTAYEYIERRFDLKSRLLVSLLFLMQRGLQAGITIYAPAIILCTILGWNLYVTIVAIGLLVIVYTVSGGTRAVSQTQLFQMAVMIGGMLVAIGITLSLLPDGVGFAQALTVAGASAKLQAIDWRIDFNERYTIWSGLLGGFFLSLSYFGTDQSQVGRYLGGKSLTDSRLGLLFNGLFKIPMQVMILLAGILVYVFFVFTPAPIYFNPTLDRSALQARSEMAQLEADYAVRVAARREAAFALIDPTAPPLAHETYRQHDRALAALRQHYRQAVAAEYGSTYATDSDYIFLSYILEWFPVGLIGLLLAVILSASMSSTAGELNALSSATVVDFLLRLRRQPLSESRQVRLSKGITLLWGLVAIGFACTASLVDNLIQAINIMGSLFYGTILGVFLVGISWPRITGSQVFWSAVASEAVIIGLYLTTDLGFLWYNAIACGLMFGATGLLSLLSRKGNR